MAMPNFVSVIIPTYNEGANIEGAVRSARGAGAAEVIVVDGGSSDATLEIARATGARCLTSPPGRAAQQNAGAAVACGDILLFLHADNRLPVDAVAQIEQALAPPSTAVHGAFRQRIQHPGWMFRWLEKGNAWRVRSMGIAYGDQGLFFRRPAFDAVGGFPDESFLEDLILARRMRRHAWPLLLPGPLEVNPRRWIRHGVIRQTLRNWMILLAYHGGVSPSRLAKFYHRHDRVGPTAS